MIAPVTTSKFILIDEISLKKKIKRCIVNLLLYIVLQKENVYVPHNIFLVKTMVE